MRLLILKKVVHFFFFFIPNEEKKIYFDLSLKELVQLEEIHMGNNDGNYLLIVTYLLIASIHRK